MIKITTRERLTGRDWNDSLIWWNTTTKKIFSIREIIHFGVRLPITYIVPEK